jgi:DNA-binding GntR family transcriptional regulator
VRRPILLYKSYIEVCLRIRVETTPPPFHEPTAVPRLPTAPPTASISRIGGEAPRLTHQTLASAAADALRQLILRGELRAGEPLRQDTLATRLGVSRIPVREALLQLEAEGLVTFYPRRGAIVSTLSLSEFSELCEMRALLEPALLLKALPHLTPAILGQAEEILDTYDAALRRHDVARWGELNWRFHATLYAPASRPRTMAQVEHLHRLTDRYTRMQLSLTHGESAADAEHRELLSLTQKRDTRRAPAFLRSHILKAGEVLAAFLRTQRPESLVIQEAAAS